MASTKISAFPSGAPGQNTDEIVIARAGDNFKLTLSDIPTAGGGTELITTDVATLIGLRDSFTLTPLAVYEVTDASNTVGMYITALTTGSLDLNNCSRVMNIPSTYAVGFDTYSNYILGVWYSGLAISVGGLAIHGGLLWENQTGAVGTATDDFTLDAVNWTVVPNDNSYLTAYIPVVFRCAFDLDNNWINRQWDTKGNEVGIDYFTNTNIWSFGTNPCDATDWNYETSGSSFVNNKAIGIYNNITGSAEGIAENTCVYGLIKNNRMTGVLGTVHGNVSSGGIYNNTSTSGYITGNIGGAIYSNGALIISNNNCISGIYSNGATVTTINNNTCPAITSNNVNGAISYNSNNGAISSNTSAVDSISYNSNNGTIATNSNTGAITGNSNNGNISGNTNPTVDITYNSNGGVISTNSIGGNISTNSNSLYITGNLSAVKGISDNSNSGFIGTNNCGFITANTNSGHISANLCGDIVSNSNTGNIASNAATVTAVEFNSNTGNITSNAVTGSIYFNSNGGDLSLNAATVTGVEYNHCAGRIYSNSNTGLISTNSNNGSIESNAASVDGIAYNSNNGGITSNSNTGAITWNSNGGAIGNNGSGISDISQNANNNYISNNSSAGSFYIKYNINNGYISAVQVANVTDTVTNK